MAIYLPELKPHDVSFPPLHRAFKEPDGLLAIGGDLSVPRLLSAYHQGIFPWFNQDDPLLWWSPSVRAVFAPETLKLNRTLKKQLRRHQLHFSLNTAFAKVIRLCAAPRAKQPDTWISPPMQQAYCQLHRQGHAHSIEVWQQDDLVGGLYGVQVGGLFCGESMFNRIPDMAKLALIALQTHLRHAGQGWIDCQMPNPFLLQLGAQPLARDEYIKLLTNQRQQQLPSAHWHARVLLPDQIDD